MTRPIVLLLIIIATIPSLHADNWPAWRGPRATGVTTETNLPERWSATENIAWQARLRGAGVSSPVVFGNRVFVTSQEGTGTRRQGNHPSLIQGPDRSTSGEATLTGSAASDATRFVVSPTEARLARPRSPDQQPVMPRASWSRRSTRPTVRARGST